MVKPLHTSEHYFITFNLHLATSELPTPQPVTFRRNLRSLSPSNLTSLLSSSLPSPTHFSALGVNTATDTLCSTLTSCLDHICPLSSRPAHAAPSNSWLSDVLCEHLSELRAAERKWRKSKDPSDQSIYQSLLSSFSAEVHYQGFILPQQDQQCIWHTQSLQNIKLSPLSPPPSPSTSLTADDFATFFTNKTSSISSQF